MHERMYGVCGCVRMQRSHVRQGIVNDVGQK